MLIKQLSPDAMHRGVFVFIQDGFAGERAALLCTKHIKPKRHTAVAVFDAVGGFV